MNSLQLKDGSVITGITQLEERFMKGQEPSLFFVFEDYDIAALISKLTDENLEEIKVLDDEGVEMATLSYNTFKSLSRSYRGDTIWLQVTIE